VLHLVPPGEDRPRLAIEAAEAWTRGEVTAEFVRSAAVSAAYAAYDAAGSAARSAAYAAYDAAGSAAYAAVSAAYAAYAADADAAGSAAYAAVSAADDAYAAACKRQCNTIRKFIPRR
jgi:hypothetical protein